MNEYCTYEDLVEYQNLDADGDITLSEAEIDELRNYCTIASRQVDLYTNRQFYPRSEVRYYDWPEGDLGVLYIDEDLLEVDELTTDNDNTTISSDDYFLMRSGSYNETPYNRIVLNQNGDNTTFEYSDTHQRSQKVDGIWGYHGQWDDAWRDSDDTVQNAGGITAADTTIEVADADGDDSHGFAPRFKVQQLIKIGDEYLYILDKDETSDELTVRRGVNGTTASAHSNGDDIDVYQPMDDIYRAARRIAAWLYSQRDAPMTRTIQRTETGITVELPEGLPRDVELTLQNYVRYW